MTPDMLKYSLYLSKDGIEDIKVGIQINTMGSLKNLRLVVLPLLIKHVQLHTKIRF
jgi:hypothetical protein